MLFKTRVGLCVLSEDFEIHAFSPAATRAWNIVTQRRADSEMEGRSIFGRKVRFMGPWYFLAAFADTPTVESEIGDAMHMIYAAFATSASVCDLSNVGSVEAWSTISRSRRPIRWR